MSIARGNHEIRQGSFSIIDRGIRDLLHMIGFVNFRCHRRCLEFFNLYFMCVCMYVCMFIVMLLQEWNCLSSTDCIHLYTATKLISHCSSNVYSSKQF